VPTLSVCVFANQTPAKLAAVVAPLRPVAHEIIVALDDRVEEPNLTPLEEVASRVLVAPFTWPLEANLEWLYGRCTGDWILRLDGDEVVSQDLLNMLAGDTWHRDVTHCYVPRRWLSDNGTSWLKENPWWPDTQLRLIKNEPDLLRIGTMVHQPVEVDGPFRVLPAPIYHLDLIETELTIRREKALAYLRARPELRTHGGIAMGAFYAPETVHPRPLTAPIPPEDHIYIHAAVTADHRAIDTQQSPVTRPPLDLLPGRSVSIETASAGRTGYTNKHLEVLVTVLNTGTEPLDTAGEFPVRVGAQWTTEDGGTLPLEGRADLRGPLQPGSSETTLMLLPVPDIAGTYTLSVGVVEEGRQWLGRAPEMSFTAVKQPRVTLVGGYSRHRHLGDDLIVRSLIEEIQDEFPQVLITLLADVPDALAERFGVETTDAAVRIHEDHMSRGMSPSDSVERTVALAHDHLSGEQIHNAEVAALADHIASSNLFIIAAAGSLASDFATGILWPRLIETEIAHAAGVPTVITSAGLGPFTSVEHATAATRILTLAREVHVRDRETLQKLADLGVNGPVSTYAPDAAMGCKEAQADEFSTFLRQIGVAGGKYIVASVRQDDTFETLKQVAKAVETASAEQDAIAVLLPHCASKWVDDRPALCTLEGLLAGRVKVINLASIPPDPISADLVRNATSSLGTRFHNAVLSASAARPAVLVCDSEYDKRRATGLANLPGMAIAVLAPSTRFVPLRTRRVMRQARSKPQYPHPHPVVVLMHSLGLARAVAA